MIKKSVRYRYLVATVIILFTVCLSSCADTPISYYNYNYFGSLFKSVVYCSQNEADEFEEAVEDVLYGISQKFDDSVINSDIYNFNNAIDGEQIEVSEEAYNVLLDAKKIYDITDGAYNPCVYYLVDLWGFSSNEREEYYGRRWKGEGSDSYLPLPDEKYIEAFLELSDFDKVIFNKTDGKYFLTKEKTKVVVDDKDYYLKLDLGGLIKGYSLDKIENADGFSQFKGYFSYGTSSIKSGTNKSGGSFDLTLTNPRESDNGNDTFITFPMRNISVSTSGDYEKNYFIDGKRYCHIIDTSTGSPIDNGTITATVFCYSAMISDMLSTALMVMGKDKAMAFLKSDYATENCITGLIVYEDESGGKTIYTTVDGGVITDDEYKMEFIG